MARMRGDDRQPRAMFSDVSAEGRVAHGHPLRGIRTLVDEILGEMTREFDALYAEHGRLSILPERLSLAKTPSVFVKSARIRQRGGAPDV